MLGGNVYFFWNIFTDIFLLISWKRVTIASDTKNKKPTKVTKNHISFLDIETELETSVKFTFYSSAETWGKSWE